MSRRQTVPCLLLWLAMPWTCALAADGPVSVTTRPVSEVLFHPERSAPAEVVPLNDARLSAEVNARVIELPVHVGDRVAAGDLVARLDCSDYESRLVGQQATLRAMQTRLKLARAQLERARNLRKARNISDEEVDRRETELRALQSELAAQKEARSQAELKTGRCTVETPYDAVVSERLASVGDMASPGTPLLRLVQLDGAEVSARLRPVEAEGGAQAAVVAFQWLDRRYPLQLLHRLPLVDPKTRTVELRFAFSDEAAPPGASGRVLWRAAGKFLPADLPLRRAGRLGVFLFNNGHAHFHVLPATLEGQPALSDLPPGAVLILQGRHGLDDGDTVSDGTERP